MNKDKLQENLKVVSGQFKGGLQGNTLRIKPPMCITAADVDFTLEVLDAAMTGL